MELRRVNIVAHLARSTRENVGIGRAGGQGPGMRGQQMGDRGRIGGGEHGKVGGEVEPRRADNIGPREICRGRDGRSYRILPWLAGVDAMPPSHYSRVSPDTKPTPRRPQMLARVLSGFLGCPNNPQRRTRSPLLPQTDRVLGELHGSSSSISASIPPSIPP
jgi:hypothetical protein